MTRRSVVFLPGVGADPAFWRPVGDRLPSHWSKTYLGWPGLSGRTADPAVRGPDDLVRLTLAAIGGAPADLVAQSMGGVVAILTALRRPNLVRRLVLAATSGGIDVAGLGAADWRQTHRQAFPQSPDWVFEPWAELDSQMAEVRQPALLIWGDADPISPPVVGERLARLLPDARLAVLSGADHDLAVRRAAEVAPMIEAHLS